MIQNIFENIAYFALFSIAVLVTAYVFHRKFVKTSVKQMIDSFEKNLNFDDDFAAIATHDASMLIEILDMYVASTEIEPSEDLKQIVDSMRPLYDRSKMN